MLQKGAVRDARLKLLLGGEVIVLTVLQGAGGRRSRVRVRSSKARWAPACAGAGRSARLLAVARLARRVAAGKSEFVVPVHQALDQRAFAHARRPHDHQRRGACLLALRRLRLGRLCLSHGRLPAKYICEN
jgi:hypothetical protein